MRCQRYHSIFGVVQVNTLRSQSTDVAVVPSNGVRKLSVQEVWVKASGLRLYDTQTQMSKFRLQNKGPVLRQGEGGGELEFPGTWCLCRTADSAELEGSAVPLESKLCLRTSKRITETWQQRFSADNDDTRRQGKGLGKKKMAREVVSLKNWDSTRDRLQGTGSHRSLTFMSSTNHVLSPETDKAKKVHWLHCLLKSSARFGASSLSTNFLLQVSDVYCEKKTFR